MGIITPGTKDKNRFIDNEFPPTQTSLGFQRPCYIIWKSLSTLAARKAAGMHLFAGQPQASHIKQGQLGDCWLLTALACLTREHGALERCFNCLEVDPKGCYNINLFSCARESWIEITVDDWLPVEEATGQLVFARAVNGAAWVPLLEKAMAKLGGSYWALHGGDTAWALRTLTGRPCFKYRFDVASGRWRRHELLYSSSCSAPTFRLATTRCFIDSSAMFRFLLQKLGGGALVAASSGRSKAALEAGSRIRPGHAYAVMRAAKAGGKKILKLWVPASDAGHDSFNSATQSADETATPPRLSGCFSEDPATGILWLPWADFCRYFYTLEFCTEDMT